MHGRAARRWIGAAVAASVAILLAALIAARLGGSSPALPTPPDMIAADAARLPAPERPAFRLGRVTALRMTPTPSRWAPVLGVAFVRARPALDAAVVTTLRPTTSLGTTNIVPVLGQTRSDGRLWVNVRLPGVSSSATGWLPRRAIGGYHFVRTRLVVDLEALTLTLLRDGRTVLRARVGVGTSAAPTPRGSFYVREKLTGFDDPFYGPVAFGTSARSPVLTDWPDGGSIGIHGTNRPELIPGRVSHGCIRLRNEDILRLSWLMPVGTPLTVR
jgi:hypothetical protein